MRKKWLSGLLCLIILAGLVSAALAAGGADDPILSVSWLYNHLAPKLEEYFDTETEKELSGIASGSFARMETIRIETRDGYDFAASFSPVALSAGDSVTLDAYASFLLTGGTVQLESGACEVVDLAEGSVVPVGSELEEGHRYFVTEGSGAVLRADSAAKGYADGYYRFEKTEKQPEIRKFADIENHWARAQIEFLTALGAVNGTAENTFSPDMQVTRAMFVTVLGRIFAPDASECETAFSDVAEGDWFAPYVRWASDNGIVNGYENGTFGPDKPITREQMAAILMRFCTAFDYVLPEVSEPMTFADAEKISAWAAESVSLAQRSGLINGRTGGVFDPLGTATRAEMCAVISRLYEKLETEGAITK